MKKDEYMKILKDNLQSLTLDEQNEALQYYYDYFEDSNYSEEDVIKELGTPEEVAEKIKKEFSNVPVKKSGNSKKQTEENESSNYNSLFYEFNNNEVKNVELVFAAAEVICISGDHFAVETRGILEENISCYIKDETLICKNGNHFQNFRFFSHARKPGFAPRILITVPENCEINKLNVKIDAGRFETHKLNIKCKTGFVEVGAGNCVLNGISGRDFKIRCGMGNLNLIGAITGISDIDCGMGNVKLELSGNIENYSYDTKVGLGSIEINNEKKSGFGQNFSQAKKENHFSINCGMGSVKILIG